MDRHKGVFIGAYIPNHIRETLKTWAKNNNCALSEIFRRILENKLRANKNIEKRKIIL